MAGQESLSSALLGSAPPAREAAAGRLQRQCGKRWRERRVTIEADYDDAGEPRRRRQRPMPLGHGADLPGSAAAEPVVHNAVGRANAEPALVLERFLSHGAWNELVASDDGRVLSTAALRLGLSSTEVSSPRSSLDPPGRQRQSLGWAEVQGVVRDEVRRHHEDDQVMLQFLAVGAWNDIDPPPEDRLHTAETLLLNMAASPAQVLVTWEDVVSMVSEPITAERHHQRYPDPTSPSSSGLVEQEIWGSTSTECISGLVHESSVSKSKTPRVGHW